MSQAFKIEGNSKQGFKFLRTSFRMLGSTEGERILNRCFDLQTDPLFNSGMQQGGAETFAFLRDKKNPLGLTQHLLRTQSAKLDKQ